MNNKWYIGLYGSTGLCISDHKYIIKLYMEINRGLKREEYEIHRIPESIFEFPGNIDFQLMIMYDRVYTNRDIKLITEDYHLFKETLLKGTDALKYISDDFYNIPSSDKVILGNTTQIIMNIFKDEISEEKLKESFFISNPLSYMPIHQYLNYMQSMDELDYLPF